MKQLLQLYYDWRNRAGENIFPTVINFKMQNQKMKQVFGLFWKSRSIHV
jgi:hypothetical protein